MRTGTPGFIKSRLRELREARGLKTQLALADLIGKTSSAISRWEDDSSNASPESDTLIQLAEALNVRVNYFLRPRPNSGLRTIFFRSYATALKRERARKRARLRWVQEISFVLQHYFDFPNVDVPDLTEGIDHRSFTDAYIESAAEKLRKHWGLDDGPIPSMVRLLERVGFIVAFDRVESKKL
ncbi:MAG: helix-turn-helix domain-containing protein, partial [Xanthobacteraceae bacterium]